MSFSISRERFALHLIAVVVAFLIVACGCVFADAVIGRATVEAPYAGKYIPELGQGAQATTNLIELNGALASGKTLVVLGSSELALGALKFIPYNFLPAALNVPVLAYGRGYFQSFAVYGLLAANADALSAQTKLVILVSPGWFKEKGVPVDSFIKHFQPQVLMRLYQDREARQLVHQYVKSHLNEFGARSFVLQAFAVDSENFLAAAGADAFMRYAALEGRFFSRRARALQLLAAPAAVTSPASGEGPPRAPLNPDAAKWQEFADEGRAIELGQMTNNRHWVRNFEYTNFLKDLPDDGRLYFKSRDQALTENNGELAMLARVLNLLQSRKVRALVVMEPLNPFVYKDAHRIRPIAEEVGKLCATTGMRYFDMTAAAYEPGTLVDGMHLGELGWARVNQRIMENLDFQ